MRIEFLGHACIRCTADNGKKLILDPPAEPYGYVLPDKETDYVTFSHGHKDHSAVELFPMEALLPQEGHSLKAGPFLVERFDCWHDDRQGALRGANRVYRITADGRTVVHLGDLGHLPDGELTRFAAGADVLVVPVGGVYTLEPEQLLPVIRALAPRFVLPVHYRTPQTSLQNLRPLEDFLKVWDGPVWNKATVDLPLGEPHETSETMAVLLDYASRI